MKAGDRLILVIAIGTLIGGAVFLWSGRRSQPSHGRLPAGALAGATNRAVGAAGKDAQLPLSGDAANQRIVRVSPLQILASVNGHEVRLSDLVPLHGTNGGAEQSFSRADYEYLLHRAIDQELIFQTAKAQDVELSSEQKRNLAGYRTERLRPEPGQARALTLDSSQISFEMRQAEAFLLQTALLGRVGASPNVTPEDVVAYYQAHTLEYGELPAEGPERKEAWSRIDLEIRQRLAGPARFTFQEQLLAYMNQLKSKADIRIAPVSEAGDAQSAESGS